MQQKLNKILFFGNERLASGVTTTAPVFRGLLAAGYEIAGLVIAQSEFGASRKTREPEIVQAAREHHIPVFQPRLLHEATDQLQACGAEVGVLVAYGKIVPAAILELFPRGIINIHPSLLPRHRGPTPIESIILNGESQTGVSVMQLAIGMDSGPVYAQQAVPLHGTESKAELAASLLELGKDLLLTSLPGILDGSLQPTPQDHTQATYDKLLTKELSVLDWRKPAMQLAREVRAYLDWPRSRTTLEGVDVIVTAAHAAAGHGQPGELYRNGNELGVHTSDGILVIDSLIPPGKKAMPALAFTAGYLR
jgi:methionyl-tRNA formyltransferase